MNKCYLCLRNTELRKTKWVWDKYQKALLPDPGCRQAIGEEHDDRANDLWTTWNVVQENAIKGGLRGVGRDDLGRPRRVKSRAVNGIDQDIKLNKALWLLGERMAALKS